MNLKSIYRELICSLISFFKYRIPNYIEYLNELEMELNNRRID